MTPPTEDEVIGYIDSLSNWGRWGDEDELGTLNLITPEKRVQAAALVTDGTAISCGRKHQSGPSDENPSPLLHFMMQSADAAPEHGNGSAYDWIGTNVHGSITHFDALSHYCWNRLSYNGRPAGTVSSTLGGAAAQNIEVVKDGIFTKGVLLDIPRLHGVDNLEPGYLVTREDLERAEEAEGVRVESGDVLMIRTGCATLKKGGNRPGIGADCLPFLHERDNAVLVGDAGHDVRPQRYSRIQNPIHTVCIVGMGMQLIDFGYMEDLTVHCAATGRWSFLFVASPLRLEKSTGSPSNPLAIF